MAAEGRQENPDVVGRAEGALDIIGRRLTREPYCFNFFQAVRLLERLSPESTRVGLFSDPRREVVRFGSHPSLAFPASDIQSLDCRDDPPRMAVNFLGLTGSAGVLPHVYTELVEYSQNSALRDFLDIFNHRLTSLFYLAWLRYRFPIDDTRFYRHLLSLIGLGTRGLERRQSVEDDSLAFYAGLLALQPRSAIALERILSEYFGVPVQVEQFIGAWYTLSADSTCRFEGRDDPSERLGEGTVAGDEVWDPQSCARIRLGPLTIAQYVEFLPGRQGFRRLRDLTRFYSRGELGYEVQLVLRRQEVPPCRLEEESPVRLGWTSWVKTRPAFPRDPGDAVLPLV